MQFFIDIALFLIYFYIFLLVLVYIWRFWILYVNEKHLSSLKYVMLEVKLPREINKSPAAFEHVASALLQGGGLGKPYNIQWLGNLPIMSSLEIASIEGTIHFYIRIQTKIRSLIESTLYAQYPNIEITEADDYTKLVRYDRIKQDVSLWGSSFVLGGVWETIDKDGKPLKKGKDAYKMPADFLPIKTYVDYGLDKDPKEEYKNDPMIALLEFFGSISKGEYAWCQLLIQDESVFNDKKFPKAYLNQVTHKRVSIKDMAKDRIKQIHSSSLKEKGTKVFDEYGYAVMEKTKEGEKEKQKTYQQDVVGSKKEMDLTPAEKDEIEAINNKIGKPLARCITRVMYVSKGKFNANNIVPIMSIMKPYTGANNFRPNIVSGGGAYDYPWEDTFKKRSPWRAEDFFNDYVERAGFHPHVKKVDPKKNTGDIIFWNFKASTRNFLHIFYQTIRHPLEHSEPSDVFTLNTEEIATMYHFPGEIASVPTLPRIDSIKGKAPVNLPL